MISEPKSAKVDPLMEMTRESFTIFHFVRWLETEYHKVSKENHKLKQQMDDIATMKLCVCKQAQLIIPKADCTQCEKLGTQNLNTALAHHREMACIKESMRNLQNELQFYKNLVINENSHLSKDGKSKSFVAKIKALVSKTVKVVTYEKYKKQKIYNANLQDAYGKLAVGFSQFTHGTDETKLLIQHKINQEIFHLASEKKLSELQHQGPDFASLFVSYVTTLNQEDCAATIAKIFRAVDYKPKAEIFTAAQPKQALTVSTQTEIFIPAQSSKSSSSNATTQVDSIQMPLHSSSQTSRSTVPTTPKSAPLFRQPQYQDIRSGLPAIGATNLNPNSNNRKTSLTRYPTEPAAFIFDTKASIKKFKAKVNNHPILGALIEEINEDIPATMNVKTSEIKDVPAKTVKKVTTTKLASTKQELGGYLPSNVASVKYQPNHHDLTSIVCIDTKSSMKKFKAELSKRLVLDTLIEEKEEETSSEKDIEEAVKPVPLIQKASPASNDNIEAAQTAETRPNYLLACPQKSRPRVSKQRRVPSTTAIKMNIIEDRRDSGLAESIRGSDGLEPLEEGYRWDYDPLNNDFVKVKCDKNEGPHDLETNMNNVIKTWKKSSY